jgi:MSHA pilin protein MshA
MMQFQNKAKGFTIVELVVVIIILGILAATALPRFMNVESDAQAGVADGIRASILSGSNMAHAKYIAGGKSVHLDLDDSGTFTAADLGLSATGYPRGSTDGSAVTEDCDAVATVLLNNTTSGMVVDGATSGTPTTAAAAMALVISSAASNSADANATIFGVAGTAGGDAACYIVYTPDGATDGAFAVAFSLSQVDGSVSGLTRGVLDAT